MRILITGATGMVGRNLLEHAFFRSHTTIAPTRFELNLLDFQAVANFLAKIGPDLVIHTAGTVGGIVANMRDPVRFLVENVDMGRNVVLGCRDAGIHSLLNLSSSCVYPRDAPNPLREESVLRGQLEPTNEGYAIAKVYVMRLCEFVRRENPDFQFKSIIPCNLYGRYDHFDEHRGHLVASLIHRLHRAAVDRRPFVEIWGDGTARREFMFAQDLADFVALAAKRVEKLPQDINVGIGKDLSVNEYYAVVAKIVGYDGEFQHDLTKPVGMKQKLVDVSRATAMGWQAQTDLQDGLKRTYEFYLGTGGAAP